MASNYSKLIGVVMIILVVFTLLFFLSQDLAWKGQLEFQTDFKKFTPFISILKPQDQIDIKDIAYIKQEPVWFDVYMPRDFDTIRLEFTYKNDYNYKIGVGPKIYEDNNPLQTLDEGLGQDNTLKTKSLEFDLKKLPISHGKLRFMISIPDMKDAQKGIYIRELRVDLIRKSIWQEGLISNLTKYFNYYENKSR